MLSLFTIKAPSTRNRGSQVMPLFRVLGVLGFTCSECLPFNISVVNYEV